MHWKGFSSLQKTRAKEKETDALAGYIIYKCTKKMDDYKSSVLGSTDLNRWWEVNREWPLK